MRRIFEVARHKFAVEIADGNPLWTRMAQYKPFLSSDEDNLIFTLKTVDSLSFQSFESIYESTPEPGQPQISICIQQDGFGVVITDPLHHSRKSFLRLEDGFTKASLFLGDCDPLTALNNALMLTYAFRTATECTLEMHASVVVSAGKGYLFTAPSGTGKSTHSSLWLKNIPETYLLNDDNPVVRVFPDGQFLVFGTPWSGKTPCYKQDCCPVGAIVKIVRDSVNRAERLGVIDAYASLYSSCSGFKADKKMSDGLFETMNAVVCGVAFYDMHCRPDDEAALVCSKAVGR